MTGKTCTKIGILTVYLDSCKSNVFTINLLCSNATTVVVHLSWNRIMVTMSSSATSVCSGTSKSPYCESGKGSTSYQLYPDADIQTVSPFVKYENKEQPYIWPSLYEEMDDMFDACCLIYALAELRQKARQAEFNDPTILNLPLTAFEVWKMVQSNQQHLKDCYFGKSFYLELLAILAKRHQKLAASSGSLINKRLQTQLVTFNDCNYQEEMVYGIAVNPIQQRISICFRGSVTKMDWNIDEEIYMTAVGNPVPASKIYAGSKLLIHDGFYKYLCAPLSQIRQQAEMNFKESEKPDEHEELSQYQVMLQFHIIPLLKQYPGYKVSWFSLRTTVNVFATVRYLDNSPHMISVHSFM